MNRTTIALSLLFALAGCNKSSKLEQEQGAAPPPVSSAASVGCSAGAGKLSDAASAPFFPETAPGFCVDPNGEVRAYGKDSAEPIDKVCIEVFNGECELYKGYGLERLVTLRYIDGSGAPATVSVNLSRFASVEGAYGFFTRRIVGGGDPLERAPRPLEAGAQAALGTGAATIWRGTHVVELVYTNEREPVEKVGALAATILPPLSKAIGERLSGSRDLPAAARALPTADRVPLGITFELDELFGIGGTGSGAVGYYRQGKQRWRVVALVRPDVDAATDVLRTIKTATEAKGEKGLLFKAWRFSPSADEGGPRLEWVIAERGNTVFAVGDEEYAAAGAAPGEDLSAFALTREQKLARLGALVAGPAPAPAGSAP